MKASIGFEEYEISCIIGDLPYEREREQALLVDLKVHTECGSEDKLDQTVDYTALAQDCVRIAEEGKYQMLEAYAISVLECIMEKYPLSGAKITVKKPAGLPHAKWAIVEMEV